MLSQLCFVGCESSSIKSKNYKEIKYLMRGRYGKSSVIGSWQERNFPRFEKLFTLQKKKNNKKIKQQIRSFLFKSFRRRYSRREKSNETKQYDDIFITFSLHVCVCFLRRAKNLYEIFPFYYYGNEIFRF